MITPIHKWYPMLGPADTPTHTDLMERRAARLEEEYKQALKMEKIKDKIDELEFELYVKKAEQNQLRLEIFTNRKLDILV
jgi:chromosome segregation ATPase